MLFSLSPLILSLLFGFANGIELTLPSKQTFDGGQVAMIGFLYQMMGSIALRAWASHSNQVADYELDVLLGVIRDGELYHEIGDIDALVRRLGLDHPNAYVLSSNIPKIPINIPLLLANWL